MPTLVVEIPWAVIGGSAAILYVVLIGVGAALAEKYGPRREGYKVDETLCDDGWKTVFSVLWPLWIPYGIWALGNLVATKLLKGKKKCQ